MPPLARRLVRSLASLLVFAVLPALAIDESDLLPVDQAFAVSAEATAPDAVRIRWKIADGYYLYRHRISVKPAGAAVRSGALQLPGGEPHDDEFFGKTETYRRELAATLPGIAAAGGTVSLKIKYQGCADLGICYPPQTRTLSVALPGAAATADTDGFNPLAPRTGTSGASIGNPLGGVFGNPGKTGPLPEEQAFVFEAIAGNGNTLLLRFAPAPGYYLYRDRSRFELDADGIAPGKPGWPKGKTHHDEHFGDVIVYFDPIDISLPLTRTKPDAQTVTLRATFQGCQNNGICYPPMTRSVRVALPRGELTRAVVDNAAMAATATASSDTAISAPAAVDADTAAANDVPPAAADAPAADDAPAAAVPTTASPVAPDLRVFGMKTNLLLAFIAALLGGLILNLMPCVLPVLSIKVLGLIQSNDTRARARAHARWYTAGVLVSFVALGAIVLALRNAGEALGWGFQMQRPGVVAVLGLVVFLFGLSLSGVWTLTGRWVGMGQTLANRSGASGDFFTGVLAVVVAAPCTAPMMFQALAWAFTASTASALLVFFGLGLGLAAPFLLIAYVPALARLLPKPGAWMETFKQLLAFPLYFTAVWLVWVLAKQRGADAVALWAVSAVLLAFAAWAWTHAQRHGARWARFAAAIAMLVALWPVWSISRLPPPAEHVAAPQADAVSVPFSEQRLADLRASRRVVLVNMTADWCVTCKANEKSVFARDGFREALAASHAVYMVGDWTDVDPAITAYLRRYKAVGVPLYVLYPRSGGEGTVLPTVLTPTLVREALEKAASE